MPFIRALGAAKGRYDVTKVAQRFPMFMYIRDSISAMIVNSGSTVGLGIVFRLILVGVHSL